MKHTWSITILLILFFVISQLFGLLVLEKYLIVNENRVQYKPLPFGIERPEVNQNYSFLYILLGVLFGTAILLLIIYFKKVLLWKIWYYLAIIISFSFALKPFFNDLITFIISIILAVIKLKNRLIYNLSEIILYSGLAAIFVPIMNIFSASILLVLISIYDIIAVRKSKHMVKLAEFQKKNNMFAGFFFPYKHDINDMNRKGNKTLSKVIHKNHSPKNHVPKNHKSQLVAILGGGDIAFPLIFSGVVMSDLISKGIANAFLYSAIIVLTTTISLSLLFYKAKEKKYYPAMPFITAGAFFGYLIILAIIP